MLYRCPAISPRSSTCWCPNCSDAGAFAVNMPAALCATTYSTTCRFHGRRSRYWSRPVSPEIGALHSFVVQELAASAAQHDMAAFENIALIGDAKRHRGVLLNQED